MNHLKARTYQGQIVAIAIQFEVGVIMTILINIRVIFRVILLLDT